MNKCFCGIVCTELNYIFKRAVTNGKIYVCLKCHDKYGFVAPLTSAQVHANILSVAKKIAVNGVFTTNNINLQIEEIIHLCPHSFRGNTPERSLNKNLQEMHNKKMIWSDKQGSHKIL